MHVTSKGTGFAFPERMPVRDFDDSAGNSWRVWSTVPSTSAVLTEGFEQGWLTFEASGTIRRLAPIPPGWESASPTELEHMCRRAQAPARRRPVGDGDGDGRSRQPTA